MSSFEYTAQFLTSIERTISRERLKRYLGATQQHIVNALELYEHNVALSEALYGYLHGLEVAGQECYAPRANAWLWYTAMV